MTALAVGGYLYFRLDDEIRQQVERKLANHYRDFKVSVGSARFDPDRGIAIDDLSFTPKTPDMLAAQPVLTIDELYLAGNLRIEQLLTNQMQVGDVVIRHAKLHMVRSADGQWNSAALLPLPHFSDNSPRITVEDASATIDYAAGSGNKPWTLTSVNLKLAPLPVADGQPNTIAHYRIEGLANGLSARGFRIAGQVGNDGLLDLAVAGDGIDISPALIANLPATVVERLGGAEISGQGDVSLHVNRSNSGAPFDWSAAFKVERGRLNHKLLPDPLTDVSLEGTAGPQQLAVRRMDARCGPASVMVALNRSGWSQRAPLAASIKVVGFQLSERLQTVLTMLSESQARIWQRFRPLGSVDFDAKITFDGTGWSPHVHAVCHGISLTDMEKFPYVIEQASGEVAYSPNENGAPDKLHLDLTGIGGGRPIKIAAELSHLAAENPTGPAMGEGVADEEGNQPVATYASGYRGVRYARGVASGPTHPVGFISVSGSDIPLHDQLIEALPAKAQKFVRSLHVSQGTFDFLFRAEWKDLSQRQAEVTQDIRLKDCRIRFEHFQFPLQHVHGLVTERNSQWSLNDVEARGNNDSTIVKCRGSVLPQDSGCEADLTVEATNVPLDDSLKLALTLPGQQAWDELKPQGSIDLTAHVTCETNEVEPDIEVTLRPRERTVSVEPHGLSYRLEGVRGAVTYKRGQVTWHDLRAQHDRSVYSIESGAWQTAADGGWRCDLTNVNVDRLVMSRDLVAALPVGAQAVVDKLQPTGTIDLHNGKFNFARSPQSQSLTSSWDVGLECQQAALQGAVSLGGINGGIHLVGQSDGRNAYGAGELALDTVVCKDVQLTNVRGPFWADSTHCLVGEPACLQQGQQPRRLVADAYGGTLATNIELVHEPNPNYKIDVRLGGANLGRFASERIGGPNEMNGTLSGRFAVSGTGTSMQTLRGEGELHVVDANIYQLPVLVAMLKVLRNRTPDSTAFNRCDMQFAIQGEHVHFQQINLLGDAVSLYGNGETDLNRKLDLVFYTLIGPADLPIPLWKTMMGHVSQQVLQLKVVGSLDEPKIEKKALPAANDMLKQIQSDIHDGAATMTPSTASRATSSTK